MRVKSKIQEIQVPENTEEKYVSITVGEEVVQRGEFQEDSELMEDLYKILPLTVDSVFDETSNVIHC